MGTGTGPIPHGEVHAREIAGMTLSDVFSEDRRWVYAKSDAEV
jgi:hypothetical protein